MSQLVPLNSFKRDVKKRWEILLTEEWAEVAHCLINDVALPEKYRNHELKGDWVGFWECHIKPDMLLIYDKMDNKIQLVRLGTHSELFG